MALRDVIGQERVVRLLLNALKTGRIPSALLFAGEPGIGKKHTALNFARALNCLSDGYDSCDNCTSCKKIEEGIHPDILVLEPEKGEIRIDMVREIEEALSFRPFDGKRKVVIIDEAETMNESAANALLKTLEEPPAKSVIILISSNPESLPQTIMSRCCRLKFTPVSEKDALAITQKVSPNQVQDINTLVRLSMGRPGLIMSSTLLREREKIHNMMTALFRKANNPCKDREDLEALIEHILIIMRDLLLYNLDYEKGLLNSDLKDFFKKISGGVTINEIINICEQLLLLRRQLELNLNINITWNYISAIMRGISKGGV